MLYLLHGKDTFRAGRKLNELLSFFRSKARELEVLNIDEENFDSAEMGKAVRSRTLFAKRYIVVCRHLMKRKDSRDFVLCNLKRFSLSENIFLFCEEDIEDKELGLFKKEAGKIQRFDPLKGIELRKWISGEAKKRNFDISEEETRSVIFQCGSDLARISQEIEKLSLCSLGRKMDGGQIKGPLKGDFNVFQVCDAFAEKNKKRAWMLFRQALLRGVTPEEIFWKLWWQTKTLLLVKGLLKSSAKNVPKESGLHPFAVKKALSALRNFTEEELRSLSLFFVGLYHAARLGEVDFEIGVEKILIKL